VNTAKKCASVHPPLPRVCTSPWKRADLRFKPAVAAHTQKQLIRSVYVITANTSVDNGEVNPDRLPLCHQSAVSGQWPRGDLYSGGGALRCCLVEEPGGYERHVVSSALQERASQRTQSEGLPPIFSLHGKFFRSRLSLFCSRDSHSSRILPSCGEYESHIFQDIISESSQRKL